MEGNGGNDARWERFSDAPLGWGAEFFVYPSFSHDSQNHSVSISDANKFT